MRWVRLHPYNISQKVQIVVEHYREMVAPLLNGKAKAMVVTGSRVEAVRWQIAINKYIKTRAKDKMNALLLFRADMASYQRVYTFLSQIFDYGNTDFEKRSIFFKYLLRLLKFGREREGVDLSQVVLTHHTLRNKGKQKMKLADEKYPELKPLSEVGSGEVRDPKKAYLNEIIAKVNELFKGDLTDNDKLVYVNNVIMGKLLESATLVKQAANNTKEQFANSPDLKTEIVNAIIDALDAHNEMSSQALESKEIQAGLKEILLGTGGGPVWSWTELIPLDRFNLRHVGHTSLGYSTAKAGGATVGVLLAEMPTWFFPTFSAYMQYPQGESNPCCRTENPES